MRSLICAALLALATTTAGAAIEAAAKEFKTDARRLLAVRRG